MHIDITQEETGRIKRENALCAAYLARFKAFTNNEGKEVNPLENSGKMARLLVLRGICRFQGDQALETDVQTLADTHKALGAKGSPEAWVEAMRKAVSGWKPSKYTETEIEAETEVHQEVRVTWQPAWKPPTP